MNGCFAPHTRRAMVETRPGKFLVDLFSTIDYACVEHKTSQSHVLDVINLHYFISVNSEKSWKFEFCWQSFGKCGWIVTLINGYFILGLLCDVWLLVQALMVESNLHRCPLQPDCGHQYQWQALWRQTVDANGSLCALKWCFSAFVSKMFSILDYQHIFNMDWVSTKFINNTTWHGLMVSRHIKVRLVFVEFVSDFLLLFKTWTGSLYTDHNILLNFANANLS